MKRNEIIGVGYRARSGKDTVADYLVTKYGYRKLSFAAPLKVMARKLAGVPDDMSDLEFKESITEFGITGGRLLQRLGVAGREVDPNMWIRLLRAQIILPEMELHSRYVISDVRFDNEASALRSLGATLWHVKRPGLPSDPDPSETEGASIIWDRTLDNSRDLNYLYLQVDDLIRGS